MPSSQTLTGFVYDAAGKAVSSADVKLYRAGTTTGALSSTVTNASGKWTFALSSATDSNYDAGAVDLDVQITNAATGTVGRIKFEDQVQVERVLARQFLLSPDSNASSGTAARGFFHRITGTTTLGAEMTHTLPKYTGTFLMGKSQDSAGAFVLDSAQTVTSSAAATFAKLTTTSSLEVTGGGVKVNTNKFTTDSDGNTVVAGTFTVGSAGSGADVTFYSATSGDQLLWDASEEKLVITGTNGQTALEVADGNATFADDVTITGSLTVNGTTTTINSTVTTYSDALVKLAQGTTATPAADLGFIFTRGNGSGTNIANRAMLWDESEDEFAFAFTNTEAGTTTGNVTIDDHAALHVGKIEADDASVFTAGFTVGTDGSGADVIFYSGTSGDNLTWDASEEVLQITGTNGATALDVLDGDVRIVDKLYFYDRGGEYISSDGSTLTITGATTFSANVVITGDLTISGDDLTMGTNTSGAALIGDGTNFNPVVISGDITIATNGTVTIADDAVDSDQIVSGAIDTGHLAADVITAAKIANDVIGSEHYAAGSVDTTALGADSVTGAKIGNDVIDSEHYVAASIDNEHLADNAVDSAELAAGSVDTAHIADNQVTLAKMAGLARGKIIYGDASGDPAALAVGTAGYALATNGTDLAYTNSLLAADYVIGEDADTKIDFETADEIHFDAAGSEIAKIDATGLTIVAGSLETATIDFTDGDLAMTIADGGGVTFSQDVTMTADKSLNFPQGANIKFTDLIGDDTQDDHDVQGIMYTFKAGAAITPFSPVYVDRSNEIQECDADGIASMPCIGVTTNTTAASDHDSVAVMMMGFIRDDDFAFGTAGAPVYVSTTVGEMTNTAPSGTDDVVQVIGHSLADDAIFVQPCLTTIEHA